MPFLPNPALQPNCNQLLTLFLRTPIMNSSPPNSPQQLIAQTLESVLAKFFTPTAIQLHQLQARLEQIEINQHQLATQLKQVLTRQEREQQNLPSTTNEQQKTDRQKLIEILQSQVQQQAVALELLTRALKDESGSDR